MHLRPGLLSVVSLLGGKLAGVLAEAVWVEEAPTLANVTHSSNPSTLHSQTY